MSTNLPKKIYYSEIVWKQFRKRQDLITPFESHYVGADCDLLPDFHQQRPFCGRSMAEASRAPVEESF